MASDGGRGTFRFGVTARGDRAPPQGVKEYHAPSRRDGWTGDSTTATPIGVACTETVYLAARIAVCSSHQEHAARRVPDASPRATGSSSGRGCLARSPRRSDVRPIAGGSPTATTSPRLWRAFTTWRRRATWTITSYESGPSPTQREAPLKLGGDRGASHTATRASPPRPARVLTRLRPVRVSDSSPRIPVKAVTATARAYQRGRVVVRATFAAGRGRVGSRGTCR